MKNKSTLHLLWLHYMRSYLRLALFFYYKKIEFNYETPLANDQARLFLGNHHNGLMDPLIIGTRKGQFSYFLTRASVFKKSWIGDFLKSLLMIPVYRVRDGWDQISKNEAVFKNCSELLKNNNGIILFPEGNHNVKRCVRPLSKGFTRIINETRKNYPNIDVEMVPIGLNYENVEAFGDTVILNFGSPIQTQHYSDLDSNSTILQIKKDVHSALTKLTTHIDSKDYDQIIKRLQAVNVDFLDAEKVNRCINSDFRVCEQKQKRANNFIKQFAKTALCIGLFLPYGVWKLVLEPKIKEPEFTATFRFAVVISLVPIFMLVMAMILGLNFGWLYALLFLILIIIFDLLAVKL